MSDDWKSYKNAPAGGTVICAASHIGPDMVKSIVVETGHGGFPILLVRSHAGLRAYVNACPHQYLPLDYRGKNILSADGKRLRCTNHDAAFCVATGAGMEGLGIGGRLDAVPICVDDSGQIVIADDARREEHAS
jgi:nitrite reductase/ring-hydroxylating ferredoxin subunit